MDGKISPWQPKDKGRKKISSPSPTILPTTGSSPLSVLVKTSADLGAILTIGCSKIGDLVVRFSANQSVLKGYKLFGHFDGTIGCPSKYAVSSETGITREITTEFLDWESTDMALISLLLATLTDEAMEYVLGCRTAFEAWSNLVERYASVSKSRVNHLKTELHTIQKGAYNIDKYLLRLKNIRDQLMAAGETVSDNDIIIAGLAGLPKEYGVIRTIILARESSITLREFRAQLLGTEKEVEGEMNLLSQNMNALFVQGSQSDQNPNLRSVMYGSGSSSGASSSNSQNHAHIPATTAGTIVQQSQGSFNNAHQHGVESQMFGSNTFPPGHHDQSCGYGFVAHSHSGQQHGLRSQNYNGGYRSGNGGQSRNNSNNYRTGNNFRGRGFSGGNGPYSSGTRQGQNVTGSWSGNTEARTNVVVECQICNKRGHTAVNCFHRNTGNTPAGFIVECQICGKRGHSALDCFHRANYTYQGQPPPASLSAMNAQQTSQALPQDVWIVDSGASHHMTADINVLNQVAPYQGSDNITIGNGSSLPIKHIGSTAIHTADHSLVLSKVLHCDNLSALALSSNPVFHSKIKHLDTDYHFVREKVQRGDLIVQYIPTEEQVADVFTKGLHGPVFVKHCRHLALAVSGPVLDPVAGV